MPPRRLAQPTAPLKTRNSFKKTAWSRRGDRGACLPGLGFYGRGLFAKPDAGKKQVIALDSSHKVCLETTDWKFLIHSKIFSPYFSALPVVLSHSNPNQMQ